VLRHPVFAAIPLHSDEELRDLLGAEVVERVEVHAWPLSCVQRLQLADGRRLAYKSQLPPTVEPDFYAAAASPLLPGFRDLGSAGDARIMTLDWLDATRARPSPPRSSASPGSCGCSGRSRVRSTCSPAAASRCWTAGRPRPRPGSAELGSGWRAGLCAVLPAARPARPPRTRPGAARIAG
jgi:hypothetical protein